MLINKIELKNFRNHREALFEFEKGINLILGENGSGKTSILDAIGFALFNMTLRSSAGETLSLNESSGYVKVTFTGNDNNLYTVTRKFPAGIVSLSEEGAKRNITGVNEVYKAVNSLIGNTAENPALFENVIVASQNRFTSIFDAKPAERETVFNSVFGTEIYRQMYRGLLKESCDLYNSRLTFAGGELESKKSQVKDHAELKKACTSAEKEFSSAEKLCVESEKKIEIAEKAVRNFETVKIKKEKLHIKINGISAQIGDKKKQIDAYSAELKTAESAAVEEGKLKPLHDEYDSVKALRDSVFKEITALEKIEKEFNANKDEISRRENAKTESEGELKRLNQQAAGDKLSAEGLHVEIAKLSVSIGILEKDRTAYEIELASLTKLKVEFDNLHRKIKSAKEESLKKEILAVRAEESHVDEDKLNRGIAELEKEYSELEMLKIKRDQVNAELTRYTTLLSELEDAERDLAKQSCPYLKEQCKNIEYAGSLSGYFDPRKREIADKIYKLKNELSICSDLDERIKRCANSRSVKNEQLAALRKNIGEALKFRKEESEFKQKTAEYALAVSKLFSGVNGAVSEAVRMDDYEGASAKMQGEESVLKTKLNGIDGLLKDKNNEFSKKENDIAEIMKRIDTASKKISEISEQIKDFEIELKKRIETGEVMLEKIMPLPGMKKKVNEYSARLKELEPVDHQYRRAAQTASKRDELYKRIGSEKSAAEGLDELHKAASAEYDGIIYNAEDHENLADECVKMKIILKEQTSVMMNLKSVFDIALKEEESNNSLLVEIEQKNRQINELKRKKDIAETFRENIKMLGPYISERRIKMIAAAATVNFQRMTGRTERILWENYNEQYLVSVATGAGRRRYNMLSGGEQVAVALSIRSALASEMTDCRFAIFDEPTINLDAEKREALSVSLYDMLKNLEQALVVTHDSTFREMATKVIEL